LLGCPAEKAITWCYAVAKPGLFTGVLGYDLVAVFQSDPNLGTVRFNTQFAEEAFTVYDHPKVLIFKKAASFDIAAVRQVLRAVDLSKVVHLTPKKATLINENPVLPFKEKYVAGLSGGQESSLDLLEPVWVFLKPLVQDAGTSEPDLLLPEDRLQEQQAGGTWSELFDREAFYNRYPGLGAFWFYLALSALGLVVYPLVRLAFPGLPDRGYPLSRLVGMLLLAYLVWLGGSLDIPFSSKTITWAFAILTVVGIGLAYLQRRTLVAEWRQHKRQYLVWELLTLAFFLFFLLIRLGNGDLWHTSHGGERPMEFSYLNAVIKSTSFPPYNPWFAGGYINYYYYGFVLVGTLIKWLGIIPSIAYNYVLPALFSMLAMGAFSFGWNLATAAQKDTRDNRPPHEHGVFRPAFWFGMASAVGLLILGNLGTVRQIWYGFQRLIIDPAIIEKAGFFSRWGWFFEGINKFLTQPGLSLPYPRGDWYWIPSRAIPGEPITEFPAFTFLWSDLHAHMMALPITVLAVAWAVGILLGRGRWGDSDGRLRTLSLALSFLVGGLVIGALYPTNSWDYPTYLLLVVAVLVYTLWRYYEPWEWRWLRLPANAQRLLVVLDAVVILGVLSYILYLPFWESFVRPLEDVYVWDGDRTPIWSYITHWGLFLFLIASWFIKETIDWMAATPLSSLRKLYPRLGAILALVAVWLVVVIFLAAAYKVQVAWLVLLLAAWALILIIRPGQADLKRLVLFMVGTGLVLTILVEMVALRGDLGRMNMVFKFYMQAWVLLALSAAGSLIWLVKSLPAWEGRTRLAWQIGAGLLVFGAALFPLFGGSAKISNRMAEETPHTLDSMTYMAYAIYHDRGGPMDLSEDYWAIRWMQDNIQGSPVILEGNTLEYHWGSRYTIYTGLPGVVGWNWHQRQQRGKLPTEPVTDRIQEITVFYNTLDPEQAINILRKYDVRYFVVGQLEQQYYPGQGLDKFEELNGSLWQAVYHDRHTTIYEVLP
jgi:YYY domain-containing protein